VPSDRLEGVALVSTLENPEVLEEIARAV